MYDIIGLFRAVTIVGVIIAVIDTVLTDIGNIVGTTADHLFTLQLAPDTLVASTAIMAIHPIHSTVGTIGHITTVTETTITDTAIVGSRGARIER